MLDNSMRCDSKFRLKRSSDSFRKKMYDFELKTRFFGKIIYLCEERQPENLEFRCGSSKY
jgi:hypothetical protein